MTDAAIHMLLVTLLVLGLVGMSPTTSSPMADGAPCRSWCSPSAGS